MSERNEYASPRILSGCSLNAKSAQKRAPFWTYRHVGCRADEGNFDVQGMVHLPAHAKVRQFDLPLQYQGSGHDVCKTTPGHGTLVLITKFEGLMSR
jgi:hypothetical protein